MLLLAAQFASAKTVDEVIEKYIRARGGKNKLSSIRSIYMEGIKEMMGKETIVKIIKQQDKLSRTEFENGDTHGLVLITEKEAWTFFPLSSPEGNKIPDEDLPGLQTEMDIAGPLADYIAKGHKAELLGKEMVEGNYCYKIRLTTKTGRELMFWVDARTYLVNQSLAAQLGGDGDLRDTYTVFKDYKEVDGIKFAHAWETRISGSDSAGLSGEILFSDIIVNPGIDQKMFQP